MATRTSNKKSTGGALTVWEQEMAATAHLKARVEKPMGFNKSIKIMSGIMSVDDEPCEDNELRLVVLASVHHNAYYDKDFEPGVAAVPVCFAYPDITADDQEQAVEEMAPNPNDVMSLQGGPEVDVPGDPPSCADCWANKMQSARRGKGKACQNVRRLACVTEDALESAEALDEAEVRVLKLPVMSTKNWGLYVNKLADEMSRTPFGVVTRVKVVPDAKSQFKVTFRFEELVNFDQDLYASMKKKVAEAEKNLVTPYIKLDEEAEAATQHANKTKAAAQRKVVPIKQAVTRNTAPSKPAGKPTVAAKTPPKGSTLPTRGRSKF